MFRTIVFIILLLPFIYGCSQSSVVNTQLIPDNDEVSFSEGLPYFRTGTTSYNGLIGAFNVRVDTKSLTAEILPVRKAGAIGDTFDAHITEFLNKIPCGDCVKIGAIGLSPELNISVNFKIKHPFTDLTARPDLHVFDVRGIVLVPGAVSFGAILSDVDGDGNANEVIQTNPNFLLNADGYTTHFDDSTLGAFFDPPLNYAGNLNPFRNFFMDPTSGTFDPFQATGYNVMKVNSEWDTKTYLLKSSIDEELVFTFIVDACYGQSATRHTRNNPQYFLPEFNRKEAWSVRVELFDDSLEEGQVTSSTKVRVLVKDWQAQKPRDGNFPDTNNLGGLKEKSDVDLVEISCPDFGYFEVKSRLQAEAGGNGTDASPYEFIFGGADKINAGTLTAGTYYGLVAVRDDLSGLGGPFPIQTPEGADFPSNGPDITDYTAYQIIDIEIRTPGTIGCPPSPVDFYDCVFTQAFGALQNPSDTVVGVGGSPGVILDIDYGTTAPVGTERFAMEQSGVLGVAFDTGTSGGFLPFIPGQPGYRVSSIDVDSQNRVIWSGSNIGFSPGVVTVQQRNLYATDTFHVWLCYPLPAQVVATVDLDPTDTNGKRVIAIDTDQNDDVWVIDSDKYMRKFLSGENYSEDVSAGFDLREKFPMTPQQAFQGEIFDFVINFYNKAFYILTSHHANASLYRIECDGTYYSTYDGYNYNPRHGILSIPHNGLADITIDNYDYEAGILYGPQDCQMLIGGGNSEIMGISNSFCLTRINAKLSPPVFLVRDYGCQSMALDPINDVLRVVHGYSDGNEHFSTHLEPTGWF